MNIKEKAKRYDEIRADCMVLLQLIEGRGAGNALHHMNILVGKVLTTMNLWRGVEPAPQWDNDSEELCDQMVVIDGEDVWCKLKPRGHKGNCQ